VLLALLAIPVALPPLALAFASDSGPVLVVALKRMAMTEIVFALLFAAGVLA
jgi:1,4-dihydroxy-2-naphthoate octaprenyltransferase